MHIHGSWWDNSIGSTRAGWILGVLFMEPARLPTPPMSPAPAEQPDEPAARGQARRAPRRRSCGTGGHAKFGAEVAGKSERNERIATRPRRPLLEPIRTHPK
ncbi:hypothetical protein PIB30_029123 [Stylosanthes scabra]|uniref:Uncharacterized protein n=1 Tax=Stylosanthes scabra TaxID=79078 RepID=A0ABU6VAZ7_9FABA|nr:hypothetical protein [Stylosanthes scabra]